ncbi:MAG: acyl--CoA ligase, partial [Clostridiaceae bacterium]|nr:acyl--CoA ligase [Clostridiaceae bacterium]
FLQPFTASERTIWEAVHDAASAAPDKILLSYEGRRYTAAQLIEAVERTARSLRMIGVSRDSVISIALPNIPQLVFIFYAANSLGAVVNMIHPLAPAQTIIDSLADTDSGWLFIVDALWARYGDKISVAPRLRRVIACSIVSELPVLKRLALRLMRSPLVVRTEAHEKVLTWRDFFANSAAAGNAEAKLPWQASELGSGVYGRQRGRVGREHSGTERRAGVGDDSTLRPADRDAVYLHSGGTTGHPRLIRLSARNLNTLAEQGLSMLGFIASKDAAMIGILPMFHGFGLCMQMHTALTLGFELILVPKFSPDAIAKLVKQRRCQELVIAGVPTLFEGLMRSELLANLNLRHLKALFCGGDSLPEDLRQRFNAFVKERGCTTELREGYGLTETVTVCTLNPANAVRPATVGRPLAGLEVRCCVEGKTEFLPTGEAGEICISGPTVMLGYLNNPEADAEALWRDEDGRRWVRTGDRGYITEEGYVVFQQRFKRILKVSGVPVFPIEIEGKLRDRPGVDTACAVGQPHPYRMQVVHAFIVPEWSESTDASVASKSPGTSGSAGVSEAADADVSDSANATNSIAPNWREETFAGVTLYTSREFAQLQAELTDWANENLITYARPRGYTFCRELPLTLIGKVATHKLESWLIAKLESEAEAADSPTSTTDSSVSGAGD